MTTVMISGSRSISKLNDEVIKSLNKIMELDFDIVIGDCYGVDTLVQKYLKSKNYQKVTVYHIKSCRNNLGFKSIKVEGKFYHLKDIAMSQISDYGLVIWDGKSRGSQMNIQRIKQTKVITIC